MWTRMSELERMLESMDLFRTRLGNVFQDVDRYVYPSYGWSHSEKNPRTNLSDNGDNLELRVEIPGVAKEDIQIKVQGKYLELRGTKKTSVPEGYKVHRSERKGLTFSRSFTLPYEVETDTITASLQDGILTVTLPKAEAVKPKQITIN